ncbi:hypothetical protein EDD11_006167 [Mortierella claussenii]|nr:hypothetical protein EDD11_006167 [Mortierella claussenii]
MAPQYVTLEDLDLKEMSGDTVSQLLEQALVTNGDRSTILLLDMRPPVCHAVSTIRSAISVSVPNMLLKRPMYSLRMVTEQLTTEKEIEAFSNWRQFSNIVLFDATGAPPVKGTPMFCIAQKFRREGCAARLAYIHGGYNAFARGHASLCCSEDSSRPEAGNAVPAMKTPVRADSPPRCRLHLGSLPSGISKLKPSATGALVCQTPMIENPNINPLFESVRLAMGLNTNITEEVAVRLPPGTSVAELREQLPSWLMATVQDDIGKAKLAESFQKIELGEKKRLALLTAPQEVRAGRTTELSIGAGLEKGLKNRYNHVWPFDHTRVRIQECEREEDDYINASLLKPPFCKKSYIATQGPLPSTFQDFWQMVWEQDSRVIVMLTREFEMGRIKCHSYWPASNNSVMQFGPLKIAFTNEFRPDASSNAVWVRQMRLSHSRYSNEPERMITQIQYTGWPDFGVPETPMDVLKVIELANFYNVPTSAGPMVVHCSAGCGRTGAFCVIDSVLSEALHCEVATTPGKRISDPATDVVFATRAAVVHGPMFTPVRILLRGHFVAYRDRAGKKGGQAIACSTKDECVAILPEGQGTNKNIQ